MSIGKKFNEFQKKFHRPLSFVFDIKNAFRLEFLKPSKDFVPIKSKKLLSGTQIFVNCDQIFRL